MEASGYESGAFFTSLYKGLNDNSLANKERQKYEKARDSALAHKQTNLAKLSEFKKTHDEKLAKSLMRDTDPLEKTEAVCYDVLSVYPQYTKYVPTHLRSVDLYVNLVKANPDVVKYMPSHFVTQDVKNVLSNSDGTSVSLSNGRSASQHFTKKSPLGSKTRLCLYRQRTNENHVCKKCADYTVRDAVSGKKSYFKN